MSTTQLLDTIKDQKEQILRLNQQLAKRPSIDYQNKYKKALKDIAGIIKANRQLKEQVDKLRFSRTSQAQTYHQIQKQEFQKAYQKLLKEKQQLMIQKQNHNLQISTLNNTVGNLQEVVSQLKSQQLALVRQKQALQRNATKKNQNPERPIDSRNNQQSEQLKEQITLMKQRQADYHKTILNFQQHHANLNRTNRQQEETINQLESKLAKNDAKWKAALETKQLEIHQMRAQIRRQYQEQAAILKKQNAGLRAKISELSMKVQTLQIDSASLNYPSADRQQEMELIYTLRQLKGQMQPLRAQIVELQQGNQFQKQENMREKANLKMRVMQLQAQIYQQQEHNKAVQTKLMAVHEKERSFEDQQRFIKKLEEQNRMLGGRVIVLESKDVALRNRNGQELQQRVLEFQTRIEMLLSDKENLANIKNVSIHQMIALKAYIMQLDGKLKSLVTENEYSTKKYKNYKEKYLNILKEVKKHENVVNSYKNKIFGYDKLVLKLQAELQRAMSMYDIQINAANTKVISQETTTSIEIHKRRFVALKQKLDLQQKYSKQQIETLRLNYETKLMEANIKIQQIGNLNETLNLYKNKNEQLANKINERDNQILDLKLELAGSPRSKSGNNDIDQSNVIKQHKQLISSLHQTVSTKEQFILKLEGQFKRTEQDWRRKISLLEKDNQSLKQQLTKPSSPFSRSLQTKIFELEQDVSRYKRKISELESQLSVQQTMSFGKSFGGSDQNKVQQLTLRISQMQLDLEEANSKLESAQGVKRRCDQQIRQLQDQNQTLQTTLNQQRREAQSKIQEYINSLSQRDNQMRTHSMQVNSSYSQITHKLAEEESLNHRLTLQIQNLKMELLKNEDGSKKYIDKGNQVNQKYQELKFKFDMLNDEKERAQSNFNRSQLKRKQLQEQLRQKDDQIMKLQSEIFSSKAKIDSYGIIENRVSYYDGQIDERDRTIARLNQQITRIQQESTKLYELQSSIGQLRSQNSRLKNNYSAETEDLQIQITHYSQDIFNLKSQLNNIHISLNAKDDQIENLNFNISRMNDQLNHLRMKTGGQQHDLIDLQSKLQRITMQNNRNREAMQDANQMMNQKDGVINKLKNQNRQLSFFKNQYQQLKSQFEHKEQMMNKYSSDLRILQMQIEDANVQDKQRWIAKLQTQLNTLRIEANNQISNLEQKILEKEQLLSRLNYDLGMAKQQAIENSNRISQLQQQIWKIRQQNTQMTQQYHRVDMSSTEKDRNISKISYQLSQAKDLNQQFQINIQHLQQTVILSKNQNVQLRAQVQQFYTQLSQKDQQLNRLNYQYSFNKETVSHLESQIQQREQNIARLNNQASELRLQVSRHFQQMSEKQNKISSLNFEFNQLKSRFEFLEEEALMKQNSFNQINQQLYRVQMNLNQCEDELQSKNNAINRLSNEVSRMRQEIQLMNNQISSKNQQIHRLNQQIFRRSLDDQTRGKQQVHRLTQQLSQIKFTVTNLEIQLESRQSYIEQLKSQARQSQHHITSSMVYSEAQYTRVKQQTLKLQREITNLRGQMVDKDFAISQLENQIQFNIRSYEEQKINYQQQIKMMEMQIENLRNRQKKLAQQLGSGGQISNEKIQQMRFGIKLYQQQIDRLNKIVEQLKYQVQTVRLKANEMRNQQERIEQNLSTMVLTFAQVQALRDRIQQKQNQISQVRKSLIGISQMQNSYHLINSQNDLRNQGRAIQSSQIVHQMNQTAARVTSQPQYNPNATSIQIKIKQSGIINKSLEGSGAQMQRLRQSSQENRQTRIIQQGQPITNQSQYIDRRVVYIQNGQMIPQGQPVIMQNSVHQLQSNSPMHASIQHPQYQQNRNRPMNVQSVILSPPHSNMSVSQSQIVSQQNQFARTVQRQQTYQQPHASYHMNVINSRPLIMQPQQNVLITSVSPQSRHLSPMLNQPGQPMLQPPQ